MADQAGNSEHSALCLRLMQLFPRVTRGMRRWQERAAPAPVPSPLSPRHVAALEQIRGGPLTVGELASRLDLTLPTVSGVLADLDRAGLVERRPDPADRRRTLIWLTPSGHEALSRDREVLGADHLARAMGRLPPGRAEPKNGRNRFSRAFGGKPGPSSAMSMVIVSCSRIADTCNRPAPASSALRARFSKTR